MTEEWRDVVGWAGYQVSDQGRIRNGKQVIIKGSVYRCYPSVLLSEPGGAVRVLLHLLIAQAFIGMIPVGYEVHHKDRDTMNAAASNLEPLPEYKHSQETKKYQPRGESHYKAKLTEQQVREIRQAYKAGATQMHLGKVYGVSFQQIGKIAKGLTWRHILD
jgi:hypothetical protein